MTDYRSDRLVICIARKLTPSIRGSGWSAGASVGMLGLAILLGIAPSIRAQQGQAYPGVSYPQAYQQPVNSPYGYYYGYPQGPQQPIQRAQNVYYGNYQDNRIPGYNYPRTNYVQNYAANAGGNGVTYYYVQNPYGANNYPITSPYGVPPSNTRVQTGPPAWPIPTTTPPPAPVTPFNPLDDTVEDGSKPMVSFHRTPNDQTWLKADYIATFIRPMRFSSGPLATNGSSADTAPGAIGQPSTTVLAGNSADFNIFSGIRVQGGLFLDHDNHFSLDIGGFLMIPNNVSQNFASDGRGNPIIARPIFDVARGVDGAFLTSFPDRIAGSLAMDFHSEMQGAELNARYHSYLREGLHLDALVGFRYLRLSESMQLQDQLNPLGTNFVPFEGNFITPGNVLRDSDSFRTVNQFFGPQIGGHLSWEYKCFNLEAFTKLGLGATQQQTTIAGSTTLTTPAGSQTANGGILALPSNIGTHTRTVVGIIPEFGLNIGVELTQHMRLNLGYSFLMWSHVVRPAGQIDRNINPSQVPGSPTFAAPGGPIAPSYRFNDELFWTHTMNIGLEIHF